MFKGTHVVNENPHFMGMSGTERKLLSVRPGQHVLFIRNYGNPRNGNVLVEKEDGLRTVIARECLNEVEMWEQKFNERVESVDFWKEVAANNNAQTQRWIDICMEQSIEIGRLRQKCGEL